MPLTPEERKKIYEEEKARIEAQEQLGRTSSESTINLSQNVVGVLCYLGVWVTGIIFFVLEQKNRWVRFHAAQSIVVFASLSVLTAVLGWIPFSGWIFSTVIWIFGFILWIILMAKAYRGERFKLPIAGDIAEMMIGITINVAERPRKSPPPSEPPKPPRKKGKAPSATKAAAAASPPIAAGATLGKAGEYPAYRTEKSIVGPSFAIFWSIVLLVVFNFFHQYIAYYTYHASTKSWTWQSFFTSDINIWLPVLNAALAVAIVGNIFLIIVNSRIIQDTIHVLINGFNLATILTLLVVFPFDFNVIPNSEAAGWTTLGVRIFLIFLAICFGITLVAKFVRLLVNVVKTATEPG